MFLKSPQIPWYFAFKQAYRRSWGSCKKKQWQQFCILCLAFHYLRTDIFFVWFTAALCQPVPGSRLVGKIPKAVGERNASGVRLVFHSISVRLSIRPSVVVRWHLSYLPVQWNDSLLVRLFLFFFAFFSCFCGFLFFFLSCFCFCKMPISGLDQQINWERWL